jgi:hypothetical protein
MKLIAISIGAIIVLLILPCSFWDNGAFAFDVNGFRNGMSRHDVDLMLRSYQKVQEIDPNTLIAFDNSGNASSYNLCNGILASMQQNYTPNLKQFARLVHEFITKYGQPYSVKGENRQEPQGQIDELGLWWKVGGEYISVYFMGLPGGDSLSVSHQSPNRCFKVPR